MPFSCSKSYHARKPSTDQVQTLADPTQPMTAPPNGRPIYSAHNMFTHASEHSPHA